MLMQEDLDKIGVWRSSKLGFLLPFLVLCGPLYHLGDRGVFLKKEFP